MLRDYQHQIATEGLQILKLHGLLYLAMEVRTGKTLTALAIADKYGAKKVLLLTKKKAIQSIYKDFKAFSPGFDLYVTNYEAKVHDVAGPFDLVILDEAHGLGQFPTLSQRARNLYSICKGLPIIYLSGSPTPESYSQIYHQLYVSSFSPFKEYKSFYKWAKDFVNVKQRRFSHGLVNDYTNADKAKIDAATKHLFISYTQEAAGFTSMVEEHVLKVKMFDSTYYLASKLRARRVYVGKNGAEIIGDTEVKLMGKLHQIYSGTVLRDDKPGEYICFDDSKARFIATWFTGRKIAIFYKFRGELELIRQAFAGRLTESPEEFNRRHDLAFVSQIQSGREGINLSTADALVMFNIDFSHVSYIQSRARLQTKDRETPCPLYWVFAEDGMEEKIYERVIAKKDYQIGYFRQDFNLIKERRVA